MTADANQQFGAYQHASEPRAVQNRQMFRSQPAEPVNANIMWDRRVVRGNTYAAQIITAADPNEMTKMKPTKTSSDFDTQEYRVPTPEPVPGRLHIDVQTDAYLEEVSDKVPEHNVETQTDEFLDRPASPLFVPIKTGVDQGTQILEGDLFDFELEVEPILDVLVGKTLEQSMMEVMEEEELAELRAHQEDFVQLRNAELAETQRMEEAERRKFEEKERRLSEERERVQKEKMLKEKISAAAFAKNYMGGIESSVLDRLSKLAYFYDPVEREVETEFMPWIAELATQKYAAASAGAELAVDVVKGALEAGIASHAKQLEQQELEKKPSDEEEDADGEGRDPDLEAQKRLGII